MRIVVVGASGNAGTGVLRALQAAHDVDGVVGIARRVPRRAPVAPYDIASWVSVDLASRRDGEIARRLHAAMEGADAVVHLAWAIQPNHDRELLRRTNVLGTRRVLAAARDAGVPHVVVASSVGAYSPARDDDVHDEGWPVEGIPASEYSVDKADVERLLDEFEAAHPKMTVTRLRPSLIFQRDAGAQMLRYFLGPWVPRALLEGRLPVLPWPENLRLQAIHADDVGRAYLAAVRARVPGAFNVAGEGVIDIDVAAGIVSGGRALSVPVPAVRAAVSAAWNARAVPVSPGWIDMGSQVPLMRTARAREEWGWSPEMTAAEALQDVVRGIAAGAGTASPPLRPRRGVMARR